MNTETDKKPAFVQLAYHYTRALSRWIKAGRPVRSEEEIQRIYGSYCKPCDAYDEESSSCRHCGCRVNLATAAMMNKIAMATETCPVDKWTS